MRSAQWRQAKLAQLRNHLEQCRRCELGQVCNSARRMMVRMGFRAEQARVWKQNTRPRVWTGERYEVRVIGDGAPPEGRPVRIIPAEELQRRRLERQADALLSRPRLPQTKREGHSQTP
jgi:hypothetical protein